MMKKKKMMYILLPVVLGLWGVIFYKIFSSFGGDDYKPSHSMSSIVKNDTNTFIPDTFNLINDYIDPFLDRDLAAKKSSGFVARGSSSSRQMDNTGTPSSSKGQSNLPTIQRGSRNDRVGGGNVSGSSAAAKQKSKTKIRWPDLNYGGIIKNHSSGKVVVLITINGENKLMKVGDIQEGISLLEVHRDSIEIEFHEERRMVMKHPDEL